MNIFEDKDSSLGGLYNSCRVVISVCQSSEAVTAGPRGSVQAQVIKNSAKRPPHRTV